MAGTVRVLLFASAREAVGRSRLDRPVPPGGVSVEALLAGLTEEFPRLTPILRGARFVRNGRYLPDRTGRLDPEDEFAIHPPFSGG
ncbi:MAG: MoaD/ThiS family protein [Thermoplasmata archaeon]